MNIALLGGHGQLGSQFQRTAASAGHKVIAPKSSELDITNKGAVDRWVTTTQAESAVDAWINAAAYTAVDAAEDNATDAHLVNALGAENLAQALSTMGAIAPLVYPSTDYVFAGNKGAPYNEQDPTDPQSVYGTTKLAGENSSLKYANTYVLRISWVFGNDGHNFVKAILRAARRFDKARDENGNTDALRVVDDQYGAPCSTASISNAILSLIDRRPTPGIYHFASQPHVNWHQFAEAIVEDACTQGILSQSVEVLTQPTEALNQKASRPPDGRLDAGKLHAALDLPPNRWRDELNAVISTLTVDELDA